MGEEPSFDAAAEEEYKDQYATQGQEDEEEKSKLLWHERTQHTSIEPDVIDGMLDHTEQVINLCSNTRLNRREGLANCFPVMLPLSLNN